MTNDSPEEQIPRFTVSQFLDVVNQELEYSMPSILVEGEVSDYGTSQGKWVFFSLKDEESSLNCFIPLFKLRTPLEDGMKIVARGRPKLTKWGRFSFTVNQIMPVGEGSIKKSYELLKRKLEKEGLFDPAKKREIPEDLQKIGVISSTGAAGYADFCKIINARWGGFDIKVCHTQVQGLVAPEQIIRALRYLNERGEVDIIAIIRGGGSADDLACFNDEGLAREIAASRIPVITGIGHEVDESLADLVADVRASTPSNCAEMLSSDRATKLREISESMSFLRTHLLNTIERTKETQLSRISTVNATLKSRLDTATLSLSEKIGNLERLISTKLSLASEKINGSIKILESCNPDLVLKRGYAIIQGKISPGSVVKITTLKEDIEAEIKQVNERKKHDHF